VSTVFTSTAARGWLVAAAVVVFAARPRGPATTTSAATSSCRPAAASWRSRWGSESGTFDVNLW